MSRDTPKPNPHVVRRLARRTEKSLEECAAVYVKHNCLWEPALAELLDDGTALPPVQMEPPPIPDTKPAPVRWEPMAINLGDAANAPLTINLIEYIPANPYPKEDRAKQFHSKLSRVIRKVMQEQRTADQWAAFRRMTGATTFEYEGVEA